MADESPLCADEILDVVDERYAFLTEDELHRRLAEWEWVPDGFDAYLRWETTPGWAGD